MQKCVCLQKKNKQRKGKEEGGWVVKEHGNWAAGT
jgi:hypothetical protein